MNIAKGFSIDDSEVVIPWRITPQQLAAITGPEALTEVTRDYYVTRCSVSGGMQLSLGFHFEGGKLRKLELFRHFAMPLDESYAEFQQHLEAAFGPPTSIAEADCGYKHCQWRAGNRLLGAIKITHTVVDRFGPEEHVRITA